MKMRILAIYTVQMGPQIQVMLHAAQELRPHARSLGLAVEVVAVQGAREVVLLGELFGVEVLAVIRVQGSCSTSTAASWLLNNVQLSRRQRFVLKRHRMCAQTHVDTLIVHRDTHACLSCHKKRSDKMIGCDRFRSACLTTPDSRA